MRPAVASEGQSPRFTKRGAGVSSGDSGLSSFRASERRTPTCNRTPENQFTTWLVDKWIPGAQLRTIVRSLHSRPEITKGRCCASNIYPSSFPNLQLHMVDAPPRQIAKLFCAGGAGYGAQLRTRRIHSSRHSCGAMDSSMCNGTL